MFRLRPSRSPRWCSPIKTDTPILDRQNKHVLFGQQEGRCNGWHSAFEFRNLTIDHIIPEHRGGTAHIENLFNYAPNKRVGLILLSPTLVHTTAVT